MQKKNLKNLELPSSSIILLNNKISNILEILNNKTI